MPVIPDIKLIDPQQSSTYGTNLLCLTDLNQSVLYKNGHH